LFFAVLILSFFVFLNIARSQDVNSQSDKPRKLAFVIGNGAYTSLGNLPNATNDAQDLAKKLRQLNVDTILAENLNEGEFLALLKSKENMIAEAEAVLFFYAGHGYQFKGQNYIVPVSARFGSEDDLANNAIRLNTIIDLLQDRERPTLIFLDACRNNPLATEDTDKGYAAGLAQLEAGDSTFIAFATQPGNVTADGLGRNSPFTEALLEHIDRPGLSISDLMIEVRKSVEQITLGRQTPWEQSSLRQQFYFTDDVEIEPFVLANNFAAIMQDPVLREEMKIRLDSSDPNSLHQFILRHSGAVVSADRSVEEEPRDSGTTTEIKAPQLKITAVDPSLERPSLPVIENDIASGLTGLFVDTKQDNGGAIDKKNITRRVQTELARLGCYRLEIDGLWGKGSKAALADYRRRKRLPSASNAPSIDLLTKLFLDTGRICPEPRRKKQVVKTSNRNYKKRAASSSSSRTSKSKRQSSRRSNKARKKPAVLPPDISAGVGIGGIF